MCNWLYATFRIFATFPVHSGRNHHHSGLHCNAEMFRVEAKLPGTDSDMLWMDEAGLFKSHCNKTTQASVAWSCIWPIQSTACMHARFCDERALLQHLKDVHVFVSRRAGDFRLQWPADLCGRTVEGCGFGAIIAGRKMDNQNFVSVLD